MTKISAQYSNNTVHRQIDIKVMYPLFTLKKNPFEHRQLHGFSNYNITKKIVL